MSVGIEKRRGKYAAETGAASRKEVKKETETKIDELKKKNSDLESENSELKKKLKEAEKRPTDKTVEELRKGNDEKRQKLSDTEKKLSDLEKKLSDTEKKLSDTEKRLSDLESENSELKKQLARYIEAEKADAEAAAQRRAALSLLPEAERQKKVEIALAQAKNRKEMSTMAEDLASVGY
jgi:chromosome segregation ATPase